jgi:hypothetical protein
MKHTPFKFIYPVNEIIKQPYDNVYKIKPIANLEISGTGYVSNDDKIINDEESQVVFNITQILFKGKNISYLLPAIHERPGIEKACREQLLAKMKNNRTGKVKTAGRIVTLGNTC